MNGTNDIIRIAGIELSPAGIKPVVGNLATMVKTEDLKEVTVYHGFRSAHPLIQLIVGAGLTMVGLYAIGRVIVWMTHGGVLVDYELFLIIPGIFGVWMVFDAFGRGYYLIVNSARGKRKICFNKKTSADTVKQFCDQLRDRKIQVLVDATM